MFTVIAAAVVFAGRIVYYAIHPEAAFDMAREEKITTQPSASFSPKSADEAAVVSPAPTSSYDPDEEMLSQADMEYLKNTGMENILLIGVDENPEREKTRIGFRSDVLLLLCMDFNNKKAHIISVPRDSYAPIYKTKGRWKINSAFMHGGGFKKEGFEYALKTVSNLLGKINIQHYAGVQMDGLKRLIDEIGGVDYDVDVPVRMNGRVLKKGMQHLTGQQVLDYCRARKGLSTDIGRVGRQQRLLLALFKQLQAQNKLTLVPKALTALKDDVYTNLSIEQVAALAVFASGIDAGQIDRHTLKGEYINISGANFYVLDQKAKDGLIFDIFNIRSDSDMKYDVNCVKADMTAASALKKAAALLKKYSQKMKTSQKERINALVSKVKSQRKKLPSGVSALKKLAANLTSECYKVQKEITHAPDDPPPAASP